MIAIVYLLAACFALIVGAQILITLGMIILLFKTKFTKKIKQTFDVIYLKARIGVRYWEDSDDLIPCRSGDSWIPIIELQTGKIINWQEGKNASIHFKSCDDNEFYLLDQDNNIIAGIYGYVIDMMCPKENGYGDYVIMDIDSNGFIQDWKVNLKPFK